MACADKAPGLDPNHPEDLLLDEEAVD